MLLDDDWRLRNLYTPVSDAFRDCFRNLMIDLADDVADCWIWNPSLSGMYETKSGYKWLLSQQWNTGNEVGCWSWIWKLPKSEKCKLLV